MISEHVVNAILDGIETHGYAHIENAISPELITELYDECLKREDEFTLAGIGRNNELQLNEEVRNDKTRWLDASTEPQREYLAQMEHLRSLINRHFYLGLFDYESHFARYEKGDFYRKHYDAFKGRSNRVFTTVCYLNTPESGGELIIYQPRSKHIAETVPPKAGTLVVFESERFMHEVLPAEEHRFSIAGWFRKNNSIGGIIDPPR